jgi:non-ribosomal peptide synthetase component E (peptide arylation enzyme)
VTDCPTVGPPSEIAQWYRAQGWWDDRRLPDLLADALARAGVQQFNVYSRSGHRQANLNEVGELGRRVAAGLPRRGITQGDPGAFQLPNSVEAAAVIHGLVHLGAVLVPLGYSQVADGLQRSHARAVLVDGRPGMGVDVGVVASEHAKPAELEHVIVVGDGANPGAPPALRP